VPIIEAISADNHKIPKVENIPVFEVMTLQQLATYLCIPRSTHLPPSANGASTGIQSWSAMACESKGGAESSASGLRAEKWSKAIIIEAEIEFAPRRSQVHDRGCH
jgi:hypothetical protein